MKQTNRLIALLLACSLLNAGYCPATTVITQESSISEKMHAEALTLTLAASGPYFALNSTTVIGFIHHLQETIKTPSPNWKIMGSTVLVAIIGTAVGRLMSIPSPTPAVFPMIWQEHGYLFLLENNCLHLTHPDDRSALTMEWEGLLDLGPHVKLVNIVPNETNAKLVFIFQVYRPGQDEKPFLLLWTGSWNILSEGVTDRDLDRAYASHMSKLMGEGSLQNDVTPEIKNMSERLADLEPDKEGVTKLSAMAGEALILREPAVSIRWSSGNTLEGCSPSGMYFSWTPTTRSWFEDKPGRYIHQHDLPWAQTGDAEMALSPEGRHLAIKSDTDDFISIWDVRANQPIARLENPVSSFAWRSPTQLVIAHSGSVYLWDWSMDQTRAVQPIMQSDPHQPVQAIKISPHSSLVAIATGETIRVFSLEAPFQEIAVEADRTVQLIAEEEALSASASPMPHVSWSVGQSRLVTGDGHRISFWRLPHETQLANRMSHFLTRYPIPITTVKSLFGLLAALLPNNRPITTTDHLVSGDQWEARHWLASAPNHLRDYLPEQTFKTVVEAATEAWSRQSLSVQVGDLPLWLSLTNTYRTISLGHLWNTELVNQQLLNFSLWPRLWGYWTRSIYLAAHDAYYGLHPEEIPDPAQLPPDFAFRSPNKRIAIDHEMIRDAHRRLLSWSQAIPKEQWSTQIDVRPEFTDQPRPTYYQLFTWGMAKMIMIELYDPTRATQYQDIALELYKTADEAIADFFFNTHPDRPKGMLIDIEEVDADGDSTGKSLPSKDVETILGDVFDMLLKTPESLREIGLLPLHMTMSLPEFFLNSLLQPRLLNQMPLVELPFFLACTQVEKLGDEFTIRYEYPAPTTPAGLVQPFLRQGLFRQLFPNLTRTLEDRLRQMAA